MSSDLGKSAIVKFRHRHLNKWKLLLISQRDQSDGASSVTVWTREPNRAKMTGRVQNQNVHNMIQTGNSPHLLIWILRGIKGRSNLTELPRKTPFFFFNPKPFSTPRNMRFTFAIALVLATLPFMVSAATTGADSIDSPPPCRPSCCDAVVSSVKPGVDVGSELIPSHVKLELKYWLPVTYLKVNCSVDNTGNCGSNNQVSTCCDSIVRGHPSSFRYSANVNNFNSGSRWLCSRHRNWLPVDGFITNTWTLRGMGRIKAQEKENHKYRSCYFELLLNFQKIHNFGPTEIYCQLIAGNS